MQRNSVLKVVNPVLGLAIMNQLVTGLLRGVIPRDTFQILHEWGGIAVAAAVVLHVSLNWAWIKATYFRGRPSATS